MQSDRDVQLHVEHLSAAGCLSSRDIVGHPAATMPQTGPQPHSTRNPASLSDSIAPYHTSRDSAAVIVPSACSETLSDSRLLVSNGSKSTLRQPTFREHLTKGNKLLPSECDQLHMDSLTMCVGRNVVDSPEYIKCVQRSGNQTCERPHNWPHYRPHDLPHDQPHNWPDANCLQTRTDDIILAGDKSETEFSASGKCGGDHLLGIQWCKETHHHQQQHQLASGMDSGGSFELISLRNERDSLLEQVQRLSAEREDLVFKFAKFVENNGHLHDKLEAANAVIAKLRTQLQQQPNANSGNGITGEGCSVSGGQKVDELSSLKTLESSELAFQECNGSGTEIGMMELTQRLSQANSAEMCSPRVKEDLQTAVKLAVYQCKELSRLRQIVHQQNVSIEKLCQRDLALGLAIRPTHINVDIVTTADINTRQADNAVGHHIVSTPATLYQLQQDEQLTTAAAAGAVPTARRDAETVVINSQRRKTAVDGSRVMPLQFPTVSDSVQVRLPVNATESRQRLPVNIINSPATGPIFDSTLTGPVVSAQDLADIPAGFEMTTACPICSMPIPFDATSPEAFSRHVDECISRVTRDGPTTQPNELTTTPLRRQSDDNRKCPVCNNNFPVDRYSQAEWERHVDDHFVFNEPLADQFVAL